MRLLSALTLLIVYSSAGLAAVPTRVRVQNAASYSSMVAPGALISIFGRDLASATASAESNFPYTLAGTKVTAGGKPLPLLYVSPQQINALVPLGTVGTKVTSTEGVESEVLQIVVESAGGKSDTVSVPLLAYAPGLFSLDASGHGEVLALDIHSQLVESVQPGDVLTFFATGLGAVDAEGDCVKKPTLLFGGSPAQAQTAILTELPGVYEITAVVPAVLKANEVGIYGSSTCCGEELSTQPMTLPLAPSRSTTNVVAEIQAIYTGAKISVSPAPWVGQLKLSFALAADAKPFSVVLKLRYSRQTLSTIDIDPAAGTAKVSMAVPTMKERNGDFSGSTFVARDLVTGTAFPGGIVPASRLNTAAMSALQPVPLPNSASGTHEATAAVQSGKSFTLAPELGYFAAFVDLPASASGGTVYDEVVVFVDGRETAAQEFSFDIQ